VALNSFLHLLYSFLVNYFLCHILFFVIVLRRFQFWLIVLSLHLVFVFALCLCHRECLPIIVFRCVALVFFVAHSVDSIYHVIFGKRFIFGCIASLGMEECSLSMCLSMCFASSSLHPSFCIFKTRMLRSIRCYLFHCRHMFEHLFYCR